MSGVVKVDAQSIKLLSLVVAVGATLLVAWLFYQDSFQRINADTASRFDYCVLFESISLGAAIGFMAAERILRARRNAAGIQEVVRDRLEVKLVLLLITGALFIYGGVTLWSKSLVESLLHLALGAVCLARAPFVFLAYLRSKAHTEATRP